MTNEQMLRDLSENGSFSLRENGDWIGDSMNDAVDSLRANAPSKGCSNGPMGGWGDGGGQCTGGPMGGWGN